MSYRIILHWYLTSASVALLARRIPSCVRKFQIPEQSDISSYYTLILWLPAVRILLSTCSKINLKNASPYGSLCRTCTISKDTPCTCCSLIHVVICQNWNGTGLMLLESGQFWHIMKYLQAHPQLYGGPQCVAPNYSWASIQNLLNCKMFIVLPNLVKSWSHKIGCYNGCITLKSDSQFGSSAAEEPVKL